MYFPKLTWWVCNLAEGIHDFWDEFIKGNVVTAWFSWNISFLESSCHVWWVGFQIIPLHSCQWPPAFEFSQLRPQHCRAETSHLCLSFVTISWTKKSVNIMKWLFSYNTKSRVVCFIAIVTRTDLGAWKMECWFGTEHQVEARRAQETVNGSLMCLKGLSVRD